MKSLFATVSGKLVLATGLAIALIVTLITAVGGWMTFHRVEAQVTDLARDKSEWAASEVSREITVATSAATGLAGALGGYLGTGAATSEQLIALLEAVPGEYDTLFSSWMSGLTDGTTDRFVTGASGRNEAGVFTPFWTKSDTGGLNFSTFAIDESASWYTSPLATGKILITEPYITDEGFVMTSAAAPVRVKGEIVAIAGVDITLKELSSLLAAMETFEGGRMTLVDSNGKWVAHPDAARLTKPYEDEGKELLAQALADGKPRELRSLDGSYRRFIYPFTTTGMNTTWATILDVPETVFTAPVRHEVLGAIAGGAAILLMALLTIGFSARKMVRRPLAQMLASVDGLAQGHYDTEVPGADRHDEIGTMAGAVETLRRGLIEKRSLEGEQARLRAEAERQREERLEEQRRLAEEREALRRAEEERERQAAEAAEAARAREEAQRAARAREQGAVVDSLASSLRALAGGNLDVAISEQFSSDYEQLRLDFNETVARLSDLLSAIDGATRNIVGGVHEITNATGDMSRQTETSAATLEETAAALNELTNAVQSAASSARDADALVRRATDEARDTTRVVEEAVTAMGTIQGSSAQISKIINVIDDIAFQTNLLALNAGVEAARAGEAGRGFAVVASEVRALAQRASEAARDINSLISESGVQVDTGVALVGRAGEALHSIVVSIETISRNVSEIASSAHEQASGIAEINTAVTQLDRAQQTNAAGVEETAAACMVLRDQALSLDELVGRFRGDESAGAASRAA